MFIDVDVEYCYCIELQKMLRRYEMLHEGAQARDKASTEQVNMLHTCTCA